MSRRTREEIIKIITDIVVNITCSAFEDVQIDGEDWSLDIPTAMKNVEKKLTEYQMNGALLNIDIENITKDVEQVLQNCEGKGTISSLPVY
jgi:hypothetical protein